jgi:hypothetical protein
VLTKGSPPRIREFVRSGVGGDHRDILYFNAGMIFCGGKIFVGWFCGDLAVGWLFRRGSLLLNVGSKRNIETSHRNISGEVGVTVLRDRYILIDWYLCDVEFLRGCLVWASTI